MIPSPPPTAPAGPTGGPRNEFPEAAGIPGAHPAVNWVATPGAGVSSDRHGWPRMFASADDRKAPGDPWIHHTVWQDSATPTEEDITMFQFMQRFGRDSRARGRGTGPMARVRRRNHPLNCEALEGRQLLSGYYITNVENSIVLDDPGFSTSEGVHVDQWQWNGGTNQQWELVPTSPGYYQIVNAVERSGPGRPQVLDQQRDRPRPVAEQRRPEPAMDDLRPGERQLCDPQRV